MRDDLESSWNEVNWWVRFYSYIIVGGVIYGVAAAHVPFIIGIPWSTCEVSGSKLGCVLIFHLYEVPLVSFIAFFAWYGLKGFYPRTAHRYKSLLTFNVVANLAFFTFETGLLLDGLRREAPLWETVALSSVALILLSGAVMGAYVQQKLIGFLYNYDESGVEK